MTTPGVHDEDCYRRHHSCAITRLEQTQAACRRAANDTAGGIRALAQDVLAILAGLTAGDRP